MCSRVGQALEMGVVGMKRPGARDPQSLGLSTEWVNPSPEHRRRRCVWRPLTGYPDRHADPLSTQPGPDQQGAALGASVRVREEAPLVVRDRRASGSAREASPMCPKR
jgi:hypothetical protein